MRKALALLLLLPTLACAQAGRAEIAGDSEGLLWMTLICGALAFFQMRAEYRRSPTRGKACVVVWLVIFSAACVFPPARILLALLAAAWLLYGVGRVT